MADLIAEVIRAEKIRRIGRNMVRRSLVKSLNKQQNDVKVHFRITTTF